MPTTVVVTDIVTHPEGHIDVLFSDGVGRQYASLAAVTESISETDDDIELTKNLAIGWALARSADLSNIATIQNKDFTFDLSNPNPIRVQ